MRYDEINFRCVVMNSSNLSEIAKNLGLSPGKGNRDTIKKYIKKYKIPTEHFEHKSNTVDDFNKKELETILVENSKFNNFHLKNKLYKSGLKERICEICGQGEEWFGKKISLILDHINGISDDNRIENLRIVCPNCNATLDTHCSKNKTRYSNLYKKRPKKVNICCLCNSEISKLSKRCSKCDHIKQRKVERPPYDVLVDEIEKLGYSAVGRKYGVSDNAIRKWIKAYIKSSVGSNPTLS